MNFPPTNKNMTSSQKQNDGKNMGTQLTNKHLKLAPNVIFSFLENDTCRNPSLRLATKARTCKVASQKRKPKSERKVKEWTLTLPMEPPLWEFGMTHSQLFERLKCESKWKTTKDGGVRTRSLAHNTLRGRGACWSSGMGLRRIDKLIHSHGPAHNPHKVVSA